MFGQEGVENAIRSSGMTVLTEIPPVLDPGMWTMHPSVRKETGTPSNQLLSGNLVPSEGCYFWKQHSFLSLMSPLSDVYQLSWYEYKYMNNKIQLPPIAAPIKWASCGSRQGRQVVQCRRQGARDLPRELSQPWAPLLSWAHVVPWHLGVSWLRN